MFRPQNFGNDIQVDGAILSYTELWIASSGKTLNETNTNNDTEVYDFVYKTVNYYNTFTFVDGEPTSATIRTGQFDNDNPTAGTLIETRNF